MLENETLNAYLAAIYDGEGSLNINRQKSGKNTHIYLPRIALEMTHKGPVTMMQQKFGGKIYHRIIKSGKIAYSYIVPQGQVENVIRCIEPYMVVKAEQAGILKMLAHERKSNNVASKQEQMYKMVKKLNE